MFVNDTLLNVIWACGAAVAQRTHNPLVAGSNPAGPSLYENIIIRKLVQEFLTLVF